MSQREISWCHSACSSRCYTDIISGASRALKAEFCSLQQAFAEHRESQLHGGQSPRRRGPSSPALSGWLGYPQSPAPPPSFTGKLQPQCPPPKRPQHLLLPEKGQPVLGSLTRGCFSALNYTPLRREWSAGWLNEGGSTTIPAPAVVLAQLPGHCQVCRADLGILHHHEVC